MKSRLGSLLYCLGFFFLTTVNAMSSATATKRILVTGGNSGIGRAVCERLLQEWDNTYVFLGSRNLERGEQAVKDILESVGSKCSDRLELIQIDTTSDTSVESAAKAVADKKVTLYGIINNAGVGFAHSYKDTMDTNYFGPRRVNDAFWKILESNGRIVHVASASGPIFVAGLGDGPLKEKLSKPWIIGGVKELDEMVKNIESQMSEADGYNGAYGASKAVLNAYTVILGKSEKDVIVNSCTPGFINTGITAGMGATNPPSKGAIPPCFLMMDESFETEPRGRYYGSDCIRSPIDVYRGPGDPPFVSDEDLVDLSLNAKHE